MNRVRNDEMSRRTVGLKKLANRAEQGVLRWNGHIERLDEGYLGEENYKI